MSNAGYDYDVVIVGGGIHGVGVAQAAAAAGHRTLVLEQSTIASGTSSRSSKLIHGGLRYLEQLKFGLVRECLRERELLLQIAPDLVKLRDFIIPIYRNNQHRPWQIRAGLSIYALLGKFGTHQRFESLSKASWDSLDGLNTDGLQAVFRYQDAQTDDTLLTRAVMASAISIGAELQESAYFVSAEITAEGCNVHFQKADRLLQLRCRVLVNATGPWVQQVAKTITPQIPQPATELVQGSHILLSAPRVGSIYYLEAPQDRRAVFVMPWYQQTLVGTTETPFTGDNPAKITPTQTESRYLQEIVAHYFPTTEMIQISAFAGLRVLPAGYGRAFSRSREFSIVGNATRQSRIVHLYGGKLTSYRADSMRVMQLLNPVLPQRVPVADTRRLHLEP